MSIYLGGGLFANMHSDWLAPQNIDVGVAVEMIKANRDIIRGVKVQTEVGTYSRWKLKTLELAIEAAREAGVPVYMHLGHLFPIARGKKVDPIKLVREATAMLDAGDIMAHPFSRDPGAFVMGNGKVNPVSAERSNAVSKLTSGGAPTSASMSPAPPSMAASCPTPAASICTASTSNPTKC